MLVYYANSSPYGVVSAYRNPSQTDYIYVNNVRFWSMLAIVALHSLIAWDLNGETEWTRAVHIAAMQALKFGTIGFYFISGFLLGKRLGQGSPRAYFLRRAHRVGAPWAFWVLLFTLAPLSKKLIFDVHSVSGLSGFALPLWERVRTALFFSPYWFVPNFLFALAFLLLCRRYRNSLRFGAVLLCSSLFYGVNIYERWIPVHHTMALAGFVFYLWLGYWVSSHEETAFRFLQRVAVWKLLLAIVCTGGLALAESQFLQSHNSEDFLNTLRISNQVFSLLVVAGLMKFSRTTWPRFIDVRATTFGLFLIHPLVDMMLSYFLGRTHYSLFGTGFWTHLGVWTATFTAFYGISLVLTLALAAQPRLAWTVGQWTLQGENSGTDARSLNSASLKATAAS